MPLGEIFVIGTCDPSTTSRPPCTKVEGGSCAYVFLLEIFILSFYFLFHIFVCILLRFLKVVVDDTSVVCYRCIFYILYVYKLYEVTSGVKAEERIR